ncbi:MAG: hypothetical protein Q4B70_04235 [Lachnospiraceae bacterium]|nr:hypothetical protein [Lachnospiraceae bacterium]
MNRHNFHSLAWGIAFVGFTTQFGGGFASGAQIYQYFINFGVWALVMPFLAQFLMSLFYWYGMRYAYQNKTYDYRSFSDSFYGRFRSVFSNLYEIEYFVMVCMAPAVAFATGGSTLQALTGLPYFTCTLIIGIFIFLITLFGTDMVRKCSSALSILIIVGMMLVLIPNIIVQWDTIANAIQKLGAGIMPVASSESGGFFGALKSACIYGIFQITAIGLMYQHTQKVSDEKEIKHSMIYMFLIDALVMELAVIGLLAIAFLPELADYDVPMLLLVQSGVGSKILTPIISVLIILGAVSTGVNMIAGIVERTTNRITKNKKSNRKTATFLSALVFTLLAFGIAQFGLIPLVRTGYSYIGYATLLVIILPFVIHFISHINKKPQEDSSHAVK